MNDLHLTPEAQEAGVTKAEAERLTAIHNKAQIGEPLSKTDLKFALKLYDKLSDVVDFEEERRWQAECVRQEVQA